MCVDLVTSTDIPRGWDGPCFQHAKIVMRQVTGRRVMAKDLERAVERERDFAETALQAFSSGWDAAVEAMTSGAVPS